MNRFVAHVVAGCGYSVTLIWMASNSAVHFCWCYCLHLHTFTLHDWLLKPNLFLSLNALFLCAGYGKAWLSGPVL